MVGGALSIVANCQQSLCMLMLMRDINRVSTGCLRGWLTRAIVGLVLAALRSCRMFEPVEFRSLLFSVRYSRFVMAIDALIAPLRRIELFQGLSPLQITEIARRAERIVFKAGSRITEAGAEADAAYLIVAGDADVIGDPTTNFTPEPVEEASLVGEMAMLVEYTYGVTVVARSHVRCLKILRTDMHEQMLEDPEVAEKLTANVTLRLRRVAEELRAVDVALQNAAMAADGFLDFNVKPISIFADIAH